MERIIDLAWQSGWNGPGLPVVTDHLFNDMPLAIRHAFRTRRARAERDETVASYRLEEWTMDRADEILGPVPAAIMRNAAAGRIAACINFDGEHVDSDIAKRAIELMGTENTMIMTDRCDSARLGRQRLHHEADNTLWYQQDGVVAAGSQPLSRQVTNAREHGFRDDEIWQLIAGTAHRVFGLTGRRHAGSSLRGRLMDTRSRSLPVEVQHHLNAKLYGALPLCVVLGHKARWWFQHRFVQLCGYQFESQPQTRVFDFCDAFAYTELLRPQRIERAAGEQLALTEFLINSIDTGKYPIVMVDNTMLTGTVPAIREFLVYGYSDAGQTLHIVGFGADTRFSALTFPASKFEAAFVSGLARMRDESRHRPVQVVG